MSYFGRIAGRASGGEGPSALAQPVVRSGSPLAEFDQRLHLTSDTGEPSFDIAPAPIPTAAGIDSSQGPATDASGSFDAPGESASLEPRASPRFRAFGARQRALHGHSFAGQSSDERPADDAYARTVPSRTDSISEFEAASIQVLSSETQSSLEPSGDIRREPQASARYSVSRVEAGQHSVGIAPLMPTDRVTAPQPDANTAIESTPFAPKVRPSVEPARLEPTVRNRATDASSALGEALAKVSAWMKRPAPVAASTPARAEIAEALTPQHYPAPTAPKLVIGQIDIEVITPKEPPRPAQRRPRMPQTSAAAARPAFSSVAKQNFGARQR